jgi:hypothetical protein
MFWYMLSRNKTAVTPVRLLPARPLLALARAPVEGLPHLFRTSVQFAECTQLQPVRGTLLEGGSNDCMCELLTSDL